MQRKENNVSKFQRKIITMKFQAGSTLIIFRKITSFKILFFEILANVVHVLRTENKNKLKLIPKISNKEKF